MSEGDIITIFSQYGEPVFIRLDRHKDTGKSKGYGWLKYEDQRSTDLAVDNLSGATVMGRVLLVDHARYKHRDGEDLGDNTEGPRVIGHGPEGDARKAGDEGDTSSEEEQRPLLKEELELAELNRMDDDDPMKEYLIKEKREEVATALKSMRRPKHNHKGREKKSKHHRSHHHHRARTRVQTEKS